jgi:hypothetical protein
MLSAGGLVEELSSEDSLRLNVLVANAEAIRIDENQMVVYGLNGEQEMRVDLNPTCRSDRYLTRVREMLSSAVLDSPGGYPVFLRRWTRMGQIDNEQMDRLLRLGEPEAVMAVVCSPGLTTELARRAWWAAPYAEHARRMLENERVVNGKMGPVLAEYLIEFLPFETEHRDMLETVRLILQPGLVDEQARQRLWDAGRSKKTYRIGFLEALPDDLPEQSVPHPAYEEHRSALESLAAENAAAALLVRVLSERGQAFLQVALDVMRRPADQDVVSALLNAVGGYFSAVRQGDERFREIEAVTELAEWACGEGCDVPEIRAVLETAPELRDEIRAMVALAHIDEQVVTPIFARTDAVGSVMRKKIEPVTSVLQEHFDALRGRGS